MQSIGKNIRVQHLVLTQPSQVPTIPSPVTIDPSDDRWKSTDIMKGEWAHNVADDVWFYRRDNNTIATINLNAIGEGGGGLENRYDTVALMIAEQGNQTDKGLQFVSDASGDSTITSGYAYYEYLGTTNGDLTDYRVVTKQEILSGTSIIALIDAEIGTDWKTSGTSIGLGKRTFEIETTAPPTANCARLNNATHESATKLFLSNTDTDGADRSNAIDELESNSLIRIIKDQDNFLVFKCTGKTAETGYFDIDLTCLEKKGTIADDDEVSVEIDLRVDVSGKSDNSIALGTFNPAAIVVDQNGYYTAYNPSGDVTLTFSGTPKNGVWQVVEITLEAGETITIPENGIIYEDSFTDGVAPGAGTYKLWIGYEAEEYQFILSSFTRKITVVPSATSLSITGTQEVGETLTLNYTYNANDGGTESGSTFKWYRSDDSGGTNEAEISGATSSTYVLQSSDNGKYIRASVTPSDGTLTGVETFSDRVGAIDLPTLSTPTVTLTPGDTELDYEISNEDVAATGGILTYDTNSDFSTEIPVTGYDFATKTGTITGLTNGVTYYVRLINTALGYNNSLPGSDSATPTSGSIILVSDNFNDNSIDALIWDQSTDANVVIAETGQRLEVYSTGASSTEKGLLLKNAQSSANDLIVVQAKTTQPETDFISMLFGISSMPYDTNERCMIGRDTVTKGAYRCLIRDAGVNEIDVNTGVSSGKDTRIKYIPSTGVVTFEYWNGSAWTEFTSTAGNVDLGSSIVAFLYIGGTTTDTSATKALFDDFFVSNNDYSTQYPV